MDFLEGPPFSSKDVIAIVLGGGAGTRLFPLTQDRAKPAVPLAGNYRLVDIPISNCIHANLKRIFVLTQFQSSSLHRHIASSYRFDNFSEGFVEIMAAQQTMKGTDWYQGTADAVRQNMGHFHNHAHEIALILCGDQLYQMNYQRLIQQHLLTSADITVATIPVQAHTVESFGIMQVDHEKRIRHFTEKPKDPAVLPKLKVQEPLRSQLHHPSHDDLFLASMGIYVFNRKTLVKALENQNLTDFGKHLIPYMISNHRVFSYIYEGYWEDIGTIRAFYEAHMDLTSPTPKFDFFNVQAPIYSRARYLPASKIDRGEIYQSIIADGCRLSDAKIERCVIGIRSQIDQGAVLKNVVLMGMDDYESEKERLIAEAYGEPHLGIGKNTFIQNTIIDKNARIGDNVRISPEGKPSHYDGPNYYIRDGIVVIPKSAILKAGTII